MKYMTDDGSIFENRADADKHERFLEFKREFEFSFKFNEGITLEEITKQIWEMRSLIADFN